VLTTRQFSRRLAVFAAYCLSVVLLNHDTVRGLIVLSRTNDTASHIIAIPFVSMALICAGWREIFRCCHPSKLHGAILTAFGGGVIMVGHAVRHVATGDSLSVSVAGLVVMLMGGFLLFFGARAFRAAWFPLMFLIFAIPIPQVALAAAVHVLKAGSAEMVTGLLRLTGTPFHREGYVFSLPNFVIEIADECSGIRSSLALLLTSLLAGYLYLKTSWKKVLLSVIVLPFAIVKNGVRIVTLSLLAEHIDRGYLTGQLHHEGGFLFFLFTLALLAPLFLALLKSDVRPAV